MGQHRKQHPKPASAAGTLARGRKPERPLLPPIPKWTSASLLAPIPVTLLPFLPIYLTMIITRTHLPPAETGLPRTEAEVFVAECEACGFSAVSHYEHDAVAIIERHQARCAKHLEARHEKEAALPKPQPPAVRRA